ncbi:Sdd3p Ecym_3585 [Eremothecium cymbalariae DBVPG|uniref:Mitochondrial presequence protease n=1 Tax=Eremothecium cymbalariae (strain CBS 270.75 / DBVPG 7215 / KCTC 17166 / NRRL Y-17582) TaxID=931890 RepID=G8JQR8_ERECY|nr:Hypothetical protein Ecym_3585 [Eremothecium cymbalariae DBVPG\
MVFKKLVSFQLDYAPEYRLTKFVSSRTRLQVVHIHSKSSPLVEGYFALGTDCVNDSGAPHTLEHLIFMGSKKYPWKGLLDISGGITMSNTNAWTATDQTVYSLTSAGWVGFKKLLLVYLDHIVNPRLTDEACTTEVYYIDPKDLVDKGVVYSEMEGIESAAYSITNLEVQRLMFPEGNAYRSETGGLTKNLRKLSNEEIRKFHAEKYSPDNLCLIICGNVPEDELLDVIQEFDAELPEFNKPKRKRPFLDSPSSQIPRKLSQTIESTVEFPELDESQGEVVISWIGFPYTDHLNDLAASLLFDYLTDSSLSPFNKYLVEIENPLASRVRYHTSDYMRTIINLNVEGVPTEKLNDAKNKILEILETHKIDLTRIRQVIENEKWDYVYGREVGGFQLLAESCITDFLYGDEEGKILKESLSNLNDFETLLTWSVQQWQSFMTRLLNENKPVIVLGKPSSEMYYRLEKEQADLINERKATFSPEKIRELQKQLDDAQVANNRPIPRELLDRFAIEKPQESVDFLETRSISTIEHEDNDLKDELTNRILNTRPKDFPLFMHFESFTSQFIELNFLVNSRVVKDTSLLPYYYIFCELFNMPMKAEDDKIISFEDVVKNLKDETISYNISLELLGQFTDLIYFGIRCKSVNYGDAVKWIKHCLFDMVFDETRVRVLLEKFLNSIFESKRDGYSMQASLINRHLFTERSMKKSTDVLYVEGILRKVLDDIDSGEFDSVVLPRLETFRDQLRSYFHKFHILILGDIGKLDDVYKPWEQLVNKLPMDKSQVVIPPTPRSLETVSELGSCPMEVAYVITTPGSASSYMTCVTSIPINLDYQHPDFAAVALASEYLGCVEGPFWKGIRGSGFAYGAYISKQYEHNCIGFSIYRGTDIIKCYQTAKHIVEGFADGTTRFDPQLINAAISSLVLMLASEGNSYFNAAVVKYIDNFCKRRGPNFNTKFLTKLATVTVDDLRRVMEKYFVNMFNSEGGAVFMSCHPSKLEPIQEYLESQGYQVNVEELADDPDDEFSDCEIVEDLDT